MTGIVAGGATVVVLHHRSRVGARLQADAVDQARDQHRDVQRMSEDMDINCRSDRRRHGHDSSEVGDEIFERIIAVASGRQTVSEELDIGQEEFDPWQLGAVT